MKNVKKFIKKSFEDPIMVILLKNSNLTNKQYETFLIDIISDKISDIKLNFKEKAHLRANTVSRTAIKADFLASWRRAPRSG